MGEYDQQFWDRLRSTDVEELASKVRGLSDDYHDMIKQDHLTPNDEDRLFEIETEVHRLFKDASDMEKIACVELFDLFSRLQAKHRLGVEKAEKALH